MFSRMAALSIATVATAAAAVFTPAATSSTQAAFVATTLSQRTRAVLSPPKRRVARRSPFSPPSSPTPLFQELSDGNDDVLLVSFEGTLASANRSRSWMAVCVALRVWPCLEANMRELGMDPDEFEWGHSTSPNCSDDGEDAPHDWLLQKLSALASITQQGDSSDAMLGCDAVLLSRLLLEEQLLDRGRSNGRGGKYGGKFHPSATAGAGGPSRVGSRPLTVGELYENWHDLRDVTRAKYPFVEDRADGAPRRTDPLPRIRRCLTELYSAARREETRGNILPSWQHAAYDILFEYGSLHDGQMNQLRKNTVLLLGHEAQIPWALATLSTLRALEVESDVDFPGRGNTYKNAGLNNDSNAGGRTINVAVTTPEKARDAMQRRGRTGEEDGGDSHTQPLLLLVVPDSNKDQTPSSAIEQIVHDRGGRAEAKSNGDVFVVHSSLEVLKRCKSFLGEDAPLLAQGQRRCRLPRTGTAVTLFLPQWADNVHPVQHNDAEMDPWLNVVGEGQLLELVSGRIVGAPR